MHLSIVIPTHNRPECLTQCLDAIERAASRVTVSFDVTVVDDGSGREARERNKASCDTRAAGYLLLQKNRGMAVARNAGAGRAQGEWIAFIDDDVVVDHSWFEEAARSIAGADERTVGIEGLVMGSGDGVWDREVECLNGGRYLTCHIMYRAPVFRAAGGFDEHFEFEGPYHEDHELAARILQYGTIHFAPTLKATHLPRRVNLARYLAESPRRMRQMLNAEIYFFLKQRDRYHQFRCARSFWGTYRAIALRHVFTTLHRRSFTRLCRHPVQTAFLAAAACIEQITAWTLFPSLLRRYLNETVAMLSCSIHTDATRAHWRLGASAGIDMLRLGRPLHRLVLCAWKRRPAYNLLPTLASIRRACDPPPPLRLFLRIDDVAPQRNDFSVFIDTMRKAKVPYLAAITADDMMNPGLTTPLEDIVSSGGIIGLHGFSHQGRFGPFDSEILQLCLPDIDERLQRVWRAYGTGPLRPRAFVPPFNAVNALQILHLSAFFPVICAGPETARFTERLAGPLVLKNGSVFFPSFFPFYGHSSGILASIQKHRHFLCGDICLTVHMALECADTYGSLLCLCGTLRELVHQWSALPCIRKHPV